MGHGVTLGGAYRSAYVAPGHNRIEKQRRQYPTKRQLLPPLPLPPPPPALAQPPQLPPPPLLPRGRMPESSLAQDYYTSPGGHPYRRSERATYLGIVM